MGKGVKRIYFSTIPHHRIHLNRNRVTNSNNNKKANHNKNKRTKRMRSKTVRLNQINKKRTTKRGRRIIIILESIKEYLKQ